MDFRHNRHRHIHAEDGEREVVLCHACSNEWYRDEGGLICPACHSEITEIIDPNNDPREPSSTSTSPEPTPRQRRQQADHDSDPDEEDIEEHMAGEHGFVYNRSTRSGTDRDHHDPTLEPTLNRFIDMINNFSPPPSERREPRMASNNFHHVEHTHPGPGMPQIHRATFRSDRFGGGTASFTIYSGPISTAGSRAAPMGDGRSDPFQDLFADVMRDLGPPHEQQAGGPPPFLRGLQELIGFLNPAHAVAGDAVYSQEALDRIISNLMEANPQSNAAPPASEGALEKLERRTVDKELLEKDSKTECPICIDDMKEGDTAVFLPCKHFFHEDCVVLWLKEHNTCPICRTAIEKHPESRNREPNQDNASRPGPSQGPNLFMGSFPSMNRPQGDAPTSPDAESRQRARDRPFGYDSDYRRPGMPGAAHSNLYDHLPSPPHQTPGNEDDPQVRASRLFGLGHSRPTVSRPPSQSQSRLNEVLRTVSARQRDRDEATTTGYDTSRLQRRNSLSPTSPRTGMSGEPGSRVRQRSPSQSSGRWAASDREAQRSSGSNGPLSWLRNRFSGGDSGSGSSRDRR